MITRNEAHALLCEYTKSPNLRKHAYAVEAAMRFYAEKFGGDPEEWGLVGLLHDFDYEQYPQASEHPAKGAEILRERGYPEHIIRAIQSHADYTGLERETPLEKALFAVDELTGFIVAVALVRPTKSIMDVEPKSVRKKMKDKAFAAAVSRADIVKGAEQLGVPLDEHIGNVIQAMQGIAEELGLAGTCSGSALAESAP
ncbi:MAG: HDIG domain-containing metalloprotein [Candidatus Zipacnadales bacterium]